MTGFRFLSRPGLALALAIALASACSSDSEQPTETTSGAAGQSQAGHAGAPSTAGSSGAAGSGTAGAGGSGGAAGSTSGGGLPGIRLEDCTGLADGAICDPSSGFVSASHAFCVREECHRISEFVVTCWNMVPTCIEGESFGVFDYTLTLAGEEMCPADATCTTTSLDGEQFPFVLIDCGKFTPFDCIASELSSGAQSSPGPHQGKVRCRDFSLEETYCLPPPQRRRRSRWRGLARLRRRAHRTSMFRARHLGQSTYWAVGMTDLHQ